MRAVIILIVVYALAVVQTRGQNFVINTTDGSSACYPVTIEVIANGVEFAMVHVEGGTFQMGNEKGSSDEKPIHSVTLSNYYIGQTEVTQALWKVVMGKNPSFRKGDNMPVERVSWNDCQNFIEKLNGLTGRKFRLPTEAEWEYAARGGNRSRCYNYSGSNFLDAVAWYAKNSNNTTHDVGTKGPNELGIYDMSGNVFEWCQDWKGDYPSEARTNPTGASRGTYRILRGGGWGAYQYLCTSFYRSYNTPARRYFYYGLRLALSE